HSQRQAFLDKTALAWIGDTLARRPWPAAQSPFPLQFVLSEPGAELPAAAGAVDRHIALPMPEPSTRELLWRHSSPAAAKWPSSERRTLAEQHSIWPGDIARAKELGADTPRK